MVLVEAIYANFSTAKCSNVKLWAFICKEYFVPTLKGILPFPL